MNYPKFVDMEAKIKNDLDLNEEVFIQPVEIKGYFNEAVKMIENSVHTLYEDYFLATTSVDVTAGQSVLQLPTNIYGNKIRKIMWKVSDSEKYEIRRIENINELIDVNENDLYRYILLNNGVTLVNTIGHVINIYPNFRDTTSGTPLSIYYLRSANKYVDEDSVCDIPEFSDVVIQYVRYKCHLKEGHPDALQDLSDLEALTTNMKETLRARVIDENTELQKDLSFYRDFDNNFYF